MSVATERGRGWAPGAAVLATAARAVGEVAVRGRSADTVLGDLRQSPEHAAIRAVTLGTVRWYLRLLPAVSALLTRHGRALSPVVRSLLVVGAHQIEYSRNAPEATVDASVDAVRALGEPRASGLVNAVLRRFARERGQLFAPLDRDPAVATAHPQWLVAELARAWPDDFARILAGNNVHPPLVLRVDATRTSVIGYLAELAAAGISGRAVPWAAAAVELERALPVAALPGFLEGRVSVQDAGAQLAAPLLDARAGMRVLDACAAPGGKTVHLLEHTRGLAELVAVDVDPARVALIEEGLTRADRHATVAVADLRRLGGAPFERILLDAPCSATGVIRRHPDIKLLRRRSDVESFTALQLDLLRAAFALLAPGGRLLYCTCSVLPAENDGVIEQFLASEAHARSAELPSARVLPPGTRARSVGVQLLPGGEAGSDGFYYACLEKTTAGNWPGSGA